MHKRGVSAPETGVRKGHEGVFQMSSVLTRPLLDQLTHPLALMRAEVVQDDDRFILPYGLQMD
jgi:hypothetical protein